MTSMAPRGAPGAIVETLSRVALAAQRNQRFRACLLETSDAVYACEQVLQAARSVGADVYHFTATQRRRYNRSNKVEPMERALAEHQVGTWFSGLRRSQSHTRKEITILQAQNGAVKVHPIADWSNRNIHRYLREHDLPYHPLWDEGYVSIGDHHTSQPLGSGMTEQDTRFFGLVRECGLHEADNFGGAGN